MKVRLKSTKAKPLEPTRRTLRLLSVQGAADYAGVSASTVRRWIACGGLKTFRAGRQIRIDEKDLVDFLTVSSP